MSGRRGRKGFHGVMSIGCSCGAMCFNIEWHSIFGGVSILQCNTCRSHRKFPACAVRDKIAPVGTACRTCGCFALQGLASARLLYERTTRFRLRRRHFPNLRMVS